MLFLFLLIATLALIGLFLPYILVGAGVMLAAALGLLALGVVIAGIVAFITALAAEPGALAGVAGIIAGVVALGFVANLAGKKWFR